MSTNTNDIINSDYAIVTFWDNITKKVCSMSTNSSVVVADVVSRCNINS
jgi:hypothetical protein